MPRLNGTHILRERDYAHLTAYFIDLFAEALAAVLSVKLACNPFHRMQYRALVTQVDAAAADADLAGRATHNDRPVTLSKGFSEAYLFSGAQQIVDVRRGHGPHAGFAAAAWI